MCEICHVRNFENNHLYEILLFFEGKYGVFTDFIINE